MCHLCRIKEIDVASFLDAVAKRMETHPEDTDHLSALMDKVLQTGLEERNLEAEAAWEARRNGQ